MKKYSMWFIISIILIKIIYLIFESHYNANLIDTVSNPNTTKDVLENLEIYGHRLSSIGLTLLLIPFLYLILKKIIKNRNIYLPSLAIFSILIYNLFYALLTFAIDEFVDRNKDIQYNSYYITLFKYGMLNKEIGYSSFIPKERLENISIEDKVMISNIFLLLEADNNVIKKILDNKDLTVKSVLSNEENNSFKDKYKKAESNFNKKLEDFNNKYNDYLISSQNMDSKISSKDNEKELNRLYSNFQAELQSKYKNYENASNVLKKSLYPDNKTIDKHYASLQKYFQNQRYTRAKEEYTRTIKNEFGRYIEPNVFCENNICPSKNKIREVMKDEATRKFRNAYGDINRNLSYIDFLKYPSIKNSVIAELKKEDLNVANDFNYSKESFAKAYKIKLNSERTKASKNFEDAFFKETGKRVKLGLSYEEFVSYWEDDIIKEYEDDYGNIIFNMIKNKDSTNFYQDFYKPYFEYKELKKHIIEEEDFENREEGRYAIKSMYVVPFAIFMSLFAGVFNLISVIVLSSILLLRFITSNNNTLIVSNSLRLLLFIIFIYYPYKVGKENNLLGNYKIFENSQYLEDGFKKYYLKSLNWVLVVEKINYKIWNQEKK